MGSSEQTGELKTKRLKLNTSKSSSPAASHQNTPTNESEENELVREIAQDKDIFECSFNGCRKKYSDKRGLNIHEAHQHSKEITQKTMIQSKLLKKLTEDISSKEKIEKDQTEKSVNLKKNNCDDLNLKLLPLPTKLRKKTSFEEQNNSKTNLT